jgi:DNA-directed RNA polymerase specialized sigma24 family protein
VESAGEANVIPYRGARERYDNGHDTIETTARMSLEKTGPARRDLTADRLQRLLERLGDESSAAGERYNGLRARLIQFFRWQQLPAGEDLADEVLNRVARRLEEGEDIPNIYGYAAGVARLVALETRQHGSRERRALEAYTRIRQSLEPGQGPLDERALDCLDTCLARLSPERREHLLAYYTGDQDTRIRERNRLAERLGIGPVALRNRMLRMRQQLEVCLQECLNGEAGRDDSAARTTSYRRPSDHRSGGERS